MSSIVWNEDSNHLNEIYQKTGMFFSFLSAPKDGNKECHQPVKCRDFLHDVVRTQITGVTSNIYGFVFNKTDKTPVDLNRIRMIVSTQKLRNTLSKTTQEIECFYDKMNSSKKILNHFEDYSGISKSTLRCVNDGNRYVWIFTGSCIWLRSPYLVSLYSFLIRLGDKKVEFTDKETFISKFKKIVDEEPEGDNDTQYLKTCLPLLHIVAKNHKLLFNDKFDEDYTDKNIPINEFHNRSGILSLCKLNSYSKTKNNMMKLLFEKEKLSEEKENAT